MKHILHFFLAGSGLGELLCWWTGRHIEGRLEQRWPELSGDGWIRQCPRCLHIEGASPPGAGAPLQGYGPVPL